MKIAIMQPYFFPYIGYFQLIAAVDKFVIYDNIEYTKKGWINRNKILSNGSEKVITIPLKKDSDFKHVNQRSISNQWSKDKIKIINTIKESYNKAKNFEECFPIVLRCLNFPSENLFDFIYNSIIEIIDYLEIPTDIIKSSSLSIDSELKGKDKVTSICKELNGTSYINSIGGKDLYNKEFFEKNNLSLHFLRTDKFSYLQTTSKSNFIESLSIIDLLMFNDKTESQQLLKKYHFEYV